MIDHTHPYPVEWIDRWPLDNGRVVTVRPSLPQDSDLGRIFVARALTPQSRYQRFQVGMHELSAGTATYFTDIDYHDHFALLAESFHGGTHQQVAEARFVRDVTDPAAAEFALAVADNWQGLGLGRRMLGTLVDVARSHAVEQLTGDVLHDNTAMLSLAASCGFSRQRHPEDARLVRVLRVLQPAHAPRLMAHRTPSHSGAEPKEALNQSAPCAAWILRDEALGAKPKASLYGLPGFATQRIARKTAPPKGFGQKKALCPPNRLRVPSGTRRAVLADKSSCF